MKGFLLGLSKLILGITVALLLLSMAGVATARYFMARLAVLPPKPLYGEEQPAPAPASAESPTAAPGDSEVSGAPTPPPVAPAAEPTAEPAAEPDLPPGSYPAVVVQPIGLILRSGPGTEHGQVGGVDYNQELIVLEEPADQGWIKVRVPATGEEGWVKAGNTRKQE